MSPNFALIFSATTWNDPPVKKEKTNETHARTMNKPFAQIEIQKSKFKNPVSVTPGNRW
jgi:hypothetical protein